MVRIFTLAVFAFCGTQSFAQSIFNFDTYNTDDNVAEEIFDTNTLTSGTVYNLQVTGTYSIWTPSFWTSPCGNVESSPMTPSSAGPGTGQVGFDIEYMFALPNASACNGVSLPAQTDRIEVSLDNGVTWAHPATTDPYNAMHSYTYQVTGQGFPIGVRHISNLNSDDYGVLRFNISSAEPNNIDDQSGPAFSLKLFPNPASASVSVQTQGVKMDQISLLDLSGKVVLSRTFGSHATSVELDLKNLAAGTYLVKVEADGMISHQKLVIR